MESVPQVLSQDTYASYGVILSGLGGGGGSAVSSFLDLYSVSTITSTLLVQANANIVNLNAANISTIYLETDEAFISSISTQGIVLDGAVLTTAGGSELLLNGIPVATTANLSSLSDWSLDPAISTLNMNGNNLIAGASGTFQNWTVASTISASNMFLSTLSSGIVYANTVSTLDLVTVDAYANIISTNNIYVNNIQSGAVGDLTLEAADLLSLGSVQQASLYASTLQLVGSNVLVVQAGSYISQVSTFSVKAVSTISLNNFNQGAATTISLYTSTIQLLAEFINAGDAVNVDTVFQTGSVSSFRVYANDSITLGAGANVNMTGGGRVVNVAGIDGDPGPVGELGAGKGILQITGLSTINGSPFNSENITTSSITVSSINGATFPQTLPNVSQWATFAASSNVNLNGNSLIDSQGDLTVSATNGSLNLVDDKGINLLSGSVVNMTARNGNGGTVNILADSGTGFVNGGVVNVTANGGGGPAGLFGRVSVVAQPGSALGVATGGVVELIANSGTSLSNATSKITLNAGGINIYSGIASPFASLFGYTYLNASLGISLVAGGFTSGFQSPGTVYLYGYDGIVLGATTYASQISGVWNGLAAPSNLVLTGRQTLSGNSHVVVSNVDSIFFDSGYGALSGVSSINGQAYPPVLEPTPNIDVSTITVNPTGYISTAQIFGVSTINGEAYPPVLEPTPNIDVSTVTVNTEGYISASRLYISTINGEAYPPVLEPTPNIEVSTVTVNTEGYISASRLYISSINDEAYPPVLEPTPNITVSTVTVNYEGYIYTNTITNPIGIINDLNITQDNGVAGIYLKLNTVANLGITGGGEIIMNSTITGGVKLDANGNTLEFLTSGDLKGQIVGLSTINGAAYPPVFEPTPNIDVSTVTVNTEGYISASRLYISSINDEAYPPVLQPTPNIEVSTIQVNPAGYISAPEIFVSSIQTVAGNFSTINMNPAGVINAHNITHPAADFGDFNITQLNSTGGIYIQIQEPGLGMMGVDQTGTVYFNYKDFGGVTVNPAGDTLEFLPGVDAGNQGQIIGLSTINGVAFPPTLEPTPNIEVSTVTVAPDGYISASRLYISSINDEAYPPTFEPNANIEVSTVTVNTAGYISASQLFISSINNAVYPPPPPAPTPNIEASTVTVNTVGYVSASRLYVSSINDAVFPNPNPQVSTLTVAPTGVIAVQALSTLTTINGQPYYPNNPLGNNFSSITVNSDGFVSTPSVLGLSNIIFSPDASVTSMNNLGGMITSGNADFVLQTPAGTARKIFLQTTSTSMQMTAGTGDIFFNNKNNSFVRIDNDANLYVSKGFLQVSSLVGISSINGSNISSFTGGGGGGGGGNRVTSVNGSPGDILIVSGDGISVTTVNSTITITNTSPPSPDGVAKLNGLYGELNISSISNEIIITPGGTNIDLALNPVQTLSSLVINPDGFLSTAQIAGVSTITTETGLEILAGLDPVANFQNIDIRNFCSTGSIRIVGYAGELNLTNNNIYLNSFGTGTSEVLVQNTSTALIVGTAVSILPEKYLFFDDTRLLFNGQDLLTPDPVFSTVTASTIYTQVIQDGLSKGGATLTLSSNQVFLDTGALSRLALDNTNFLLESASGPSVATAEGQGLVLAGYNNTTAAADNKITLDYDGGINLSTVGCLLNLNSAGLVTLKSESADVTVGSGAVNILVSATDAPPTLPTGLSVYPTKLGFNGAEITPVYSGRFAPHSTLQSGLSLVSTPIIGLTSTGTVIAQYNTSPSTIAESIPPIYIYNVEPGTDNCIFMLTANASTFDYISWIAPNLGTGPYADPPAEVAPEEPPPLESV